VQVNITLPVYNEEERLPRGLPRLAKFLTAHAAWDWEIVIANNGSTDRTQAVAEQLSREHAGVRVLNLPAKGRGGALKAAWQNSAAEVLSYMDVDLSTGLEALPTLVAAVAEQGYDLATGSRLLPGSRTRRNWRREVTSRCYIRLAQAVLGTRLSDTQCGFKAIARQAARELLPQVEDTAWFFDTELLVLAERQGWRIREVPVCWEEDADSRVQVWRTAVADLRGLLRLRRRLARAGGRWRAQVNH
jgi:glycosyltransferase involved in cell wall biosynthesis